MTDRELSIKNYATHHYIDPPYNDIILKSHNFFFLNPDGYWVENIKRKKHNYGDGWYIKEIDFFRELRNINRKIKLQNLTRKK